jgi:hypothetical protein
MTWRMKDIVHVLKIVDFKVYNARKSHVSFKNVDFLSKMEIFFQKCQFSFKNHQKTNFCKSNRPHLSESAYILDVQRHSMATEVIHFL